MDIMILNIKVIKLILFGLYQRAFNLSLGTLPNIRLKLGSVTRIHNLHFNVRSYIKTLVKVASRLFSHKKLKQFYWNTPNYICCSLQHSQ